MKLFYRILFVVSGLMLPITLLSAAASAVRGQFRWMIILLILFGCLYYVFTDCRKELSR